MVDRSTNSGSETVQREPPRASYLTSTSLATAAAEPPPPAARA
jgi:hypothetical protein